MSARLFRLAYQLRTHKFADTQQDVLARNLGLLAAAIIVLQWLARGRPPLPVWHWLVLALILLGVLGLVVLRNWAARAGYVRFTPQPALDAPRPLRMAPDDKEAAFVTGRFEVEAKEAHLANLTAYWRSFGSREHAIMAIQPVSRFLLGSFPGERVGMWYIFFRPEEVEGALAGTVAFGAACQPGLRISYWRQPPSDGKKAKRPVREVVHLAFESEAGRERVWADLLADRRSKPRQRTCVTERPGIGAQSAGLRKPAGLLPSRHSAPRLGSNCSV